MGEKLTSVSLDPFKGRVKIVTFILILKAALFEIYISSPPFGAFRPPLHPMVRVPTRRILKLSHGAYECHLVQVVIV